MRLLNVHTYVLQSFPDERSRPPYVIASHRWQDQEITYQEFIKARNDNSLVESGAFEKVLKFCRFVRNDLNSKLPRSAFGESDAASAAAHEIPRLDIVKARQYLSAFEREGIRHGLLDGATARTTLGYAGINKSVLEKIWILVDRQQRDALDQEEFQVAMHLVECFKSGTLSERQFSLPDLFDIVLGNDTIPNLKSVWSKGRTPLDWIWIDTCCINKESSTELQEAINSMWRWYQDAVLCVAHLSDVQSMHDWPADIMRNFECSAWFTRGWTLQELLAPDLVIFTNTDWEVIGHKAPYLQNYISNRRKNSAKSGHGIPIILCKGNASGNVIRLPLNATISKVTGIPEDILWNYSKSRNLSIDQKRDWIVHRTTTRVEDMAYCMLGIFGVYMPLIYGEGSEHAFDRLEEAIEQKQRRIRIKAQNNALDLIED